MPLTVSKNCLRDCLWLGSGDSGVFPTSLIIRLKQGFLRTGWRFPHPNIPNYWTIINILKCDKAAKLIKLGIPNGFLMHKQSPSLVLASPSHPLLESAKGLTLALIALLALPAANTVWAQNLDAEPLFGSTSLEAGFSATPFTVEVSPGGEDESYVLGDECYGYIRFAQPDFVLNYQAGTSSLGIFALSDLDITMAVNDPAGNWHCNDDSLYLSGTNSGIQFNDPQSGDYQIWVGSYESGTESITTMLAITEVDESQWGSISIGLEDSVYAASFDVNGDIVFGDDSSGFANDGECDDPRFQGPGAAFGSTSDHLFKDATDCRTQLEAGMVSLAEPGEMNLGGNTDFDFSTSDTDLFGGDLAAASPIPMPDAGPFGEVFFALVQAFQAIPGDDAGALPLPFNLGGDAGGAAADYDRAAMTALTGIDFGDNSSPFADDGECDDPRFEGPGAAGMTFEDSQLTDGNDCSSLYLAGSLIFVDPDNPDSVSANLVIDSSGINFGDNSSVFADDGECDDPRFQGPGAAFSASENNQMRDANDCRSLFESGQISLVSGADASPELSSVASTNTQTNEPAATPRETYTVGTPRGDINGALQEDGSLFASGTVYGDQISSDGNNISAPNTTFRPAPTPASSNTSIEFGDNSSAFANDGECDDPRFEGDGMAVVSFDEDIAHDANDCRAAFEAGTITLIRN